METDDIAIRDRVRRFDFAAKLVECVRDRPGYAHAARGELHAHVASIGLRETTLYETLALEPIDDARERRSPVQKRLMQLVDRARGAPGEVHDDECLRLRDVSVELHVEKTAERMNRSMQFGDIGEKRRFRLRRFQILT